MRREETLYIIGEARTNSEDAITKVHGTFYIAFELEPKTGLIVDADCSRTLSLTRDFIRRLFLNKRIETDAEAAEAEVKRRYFGSSANALVIAYQDALKRYQEIQAEVNKGE